MLTLRNDHDADGEARHQVPVQVVPPFVVRQPVENGQKAGDLLYYTTTTTARRLLVGAALSVAAMDAWVNGLEFDLNSRKCCLTEGPTIMN